MDDHNILYSNMLPMFMEDGQETIADTIKKYMELSDQLKIAVGYVSRASLEELDQLVDQYKLKNICLIIGMYFIEGMPEGSYHTALRINQKWKEAGIGEIRLVQAFKYHGKVYEFFKKEEPVAVVIGSANLGVLKPEASNIRQYEIATVIHEKNYCHEMNSHINQLCEPRISTNIADIKNMTLVRENNRALDQIELVTTVPKSNVDFYKRCTAYASFFLPLKVPTAAERHMNDGKHFTKSNVNVCYAAPRSKRKSRDWYETQLTVAKEITRTEGYPEKNVPFYIVTDDGYWFKAHTTSDGNKQFSAVGDELIMGRWLKGRLVAAGLISPINDTQKDTERKGMITVEILQEYGCDTLTLKKTGQTALDEEGTPLDVWLLSFEPKTDQEEGV